MTGLWTTGRSKWKGRSDGSNWLLDTVLLLSLTFIIKWLGPNKLYHVSTCFCSFVRTWLNYAKSPLKNQHKNNCNDVTTVEHSLAGSSGFLRRGGFYIGTVSTTSWIRTSRVGLPFAMPVSRKGRSCGVVFRLCENGWWTSSYKFCFWQSGIESQYLTCSTCLLDCQGQKLP